MICRRTRSSPRRGAVMVWLVVCLGVIIAIVALGTDGGRLMEERRRVQTAADIAALAAAADLYQNYTTNTGLDPSGTAVQAAVQAAALNGYANDGTTSTVTVNIPPQQGLFQGKAEYVEVVIQSHQQAGFSSVFGNGDLAVSGRAVACGRPQAIGLVLLRGSGAGALNGSDNATVALPNSSIDVNSSDPAAVTTGGNATISASAVNVVGGAAGATILGPVNSGLDPVADPLRTFPVPDPNAATVQSRSSVSVSNGVIVLQPGIYQGGISISGNGSVQMAPGIYIIQGGGLQVSDNGTLTGTGVLIYNGGGTDADHDSVVAAGPISLSGNATVRLTAPSDGTYRGISIFQDRSSKQTVSLSGNGSIQMTGVVYAAAAAVQLAGNSSSGANTLGGAFVSNTLQVSGNGNFLIDLGKTRPRVPDVRLVE